MSISDVYTENTYQYVATDIDYLDNENHDNLQDKIYLNGIINERITHHNFVWDFEKFV